MAERKRPPKQVRAYHKGNVAEDLYAAASDILKTERFEDVSVRRLTQIVGVTPANFYNHYPSLNYLMQLIAADGFRQLAKIKRSVWNAAKSRKDAARQTAIKYVEFATANKQLFRIMFGQIPDDQRDPALRGAADEGFGETVELVYGKSLYDPNDFPPRTSEPSLPTRFSRCCTAWLASRWRGNSPSKAGRRTR